MPCNKRVLDPHSGDVDDIARNSREHDLPCLKPLKTVEELRAGDALVEVYATKIPVKAASRVLDALKSVSPENGFDLQHLRRFAKTTDIPLHLEFLTSSINQEPTGPSLSLILGTTKEFTAQTLQTILQNTLGPNCNKIHTLAVPLLAPTSQEQASSSTKKYWPTVYKKNNPYGPHPSIVSRAEQQIVPDVARYMALAAQAAQEVKTGQIGEAIGAIIVFREGDKSQPVCLAGDARWKGIESRTGPGNVTAHAAMRAIGIVAQKLKALEQKKSTADLAGVDIMENEIFMDLPLTALEKSIYNKHDIAVDGYLCHNLEIYITHEPCVMCCMAILHSRFGRVVFGRRMPKTGGMCAESSACHDPDGDSGLGLGLFWRKELNWSLLGWQWSSERETDSNPISPNVQV